MTSAAKWYIVHAYSNFEKKVAESIKEGAALKGLSDKIERIDVPCEEVTEVVRGKKRVSERRFFPGYVMVKMVMDDDTYHLIKETPKVTGFLGSDHGKRPVPVPQREVDAILNQVEEGVSRPKAQITFEVGEKVRVIEGHFQSFEGVVEEVDNAKERLKVAVSIFGRATPVDMEFNQVQKLS